MSLVRIFRIKVSAYLRAYKKARRYVRNWYLLLLYALLRKEGVFRFREDGCLRYNARQLIIFLVRSDLSHFKLLTIEEGMCKGLLYGYSFVFPVNMLAQMFLDSEGLVKDFHGVDVKDAAVLDIGAYLGDSVIYWLHRGAKKVIAVEPVPEHFQILLLNCQGLPVEPILGSVGSRVPKRENMIGSQFYGVGMTNRSSEFLDVPLLDFLGLVKKI